MYIDGVIKKVKMEMRRKTVRFSEEEGEWRLSGLLYADVLASHDESEKRFENDDRTL